MNRIGIDFITVFGLPPVAFVELAARLGVGSIGMALAPIPPNPHDYPLWSMRDDPQLRRDLLSALSDNGITLSIASGGSFLVRPGVDIRDRQADFDLLAELGITLANISTIEPDLPRGRDQLATFVEMAQAVGMNAAIEFGPTWAVEDLPAALDTIRHVGKPGFGLTVDAMHFFRSGGEATDLAALDPELIAYVQICDVPKVSAFPTYMDEARYERLVPGEGALPLSDFLRAVPGDVGIGLEIPMLAQALAGVGPEERLRPWVEATRRLIEEVLA